MPQFEESLCLASCVTSGRGCSSFLVSVIRMEIIIITADPNQSSLENRGAEAGSPEPCWILAIISLELGRPTPLGTRGQPSSE